MFAHLIEEKDLKDAFLKMNKVKHKGIRTMLLEFLETIKKQINSMKEKEAYAIKNIHALIKDLGDIAKLLLDEEESTISDVTLKLAEMTKNKNYQDFSIQLKALKIYIRSQKFDIDFTASIINKNNIISFERKKVSANPGITIKAKTPFEDSVTTYTVKQGNRIGNTLMEAFASKVMANLKGVDQKYVAPAHLVHLNPESPKAHDIKDMCAEQVWVASEWSKDEVSYEACKLFGLSKRKRMAGTFMKALFIGIRYLNSEAKLGLEIIVFISSIISDFDLHAENFMLKCNTSKILERDKKIVQTTIQELHDFICDAEGLDCTSKKAVIAHVEKLIKIIKKLQFYGVSVFFHKIDHDSGFYRYEHPDRKVDLLDHKTSPLHQPKGSLIKLQPTLHIAELIGDQSGIEQLFFSDLGRSLLEMNEFDKIKESIIHVLNSNFFKEIKDMAGKIRRPTGFLTKDEELKAEYTLLNEFYYQITEEYYSSSTKLPMEMQINKLQLQISSSLFTGILYKVHDLHIQLYAQLKLKQYLTLEEINLMQFIKNQLQICLATHLMNKWKGIVKQYETPSLNLLRTKSEESKAFIHEMNRIFLLTENTYFLIRSPIKGLNMIMNFLASYPSKQLAKCIKKAMEPFNYTEFVEVLDKDFEPRMQIKKK